MANAVATMIGVAVVNTLAFSDSNCLFSHMVKKGDADAERERHNKAKEQLQAAEASWSK